LAVETGAELPGLAVQVAVVLAAAVLGQRVLQIKDMRVAMD
jgi:hypothetical protein